MGWKIWSKYVKGGKLLRTKYRSDLS
jgi:hypothetical protein